MKRLLLTALLAVAWGSSDVATWAASPNALKNAYWRFEEGVNGVAVVPGIKNVLDTADNSADPPILAAHLQAANSNTAPTYTSDVAPFQLRSGLPNALAMQFTPHQGGGDDVYTTNNDTPTSADINNGMIGGTVAPAITGFTIEAAFRPDDVGSGPYRGIIAKEGSAPGSSLPTLALKVRGDNGNLQFEQLDLTGAPREVQSSVPLVAGEWYAAAAVNDGTTLSLYLDSNDGNGYVLQGSTAVDGALYQGASMNDWGQPWSVGRAWHGGGAADWFDGIIDEVRLTNRALDPSEFLFVGAAIPEPSSVALVCCGLVALGGWRLRRRRAS